MNLLQGGERTFAGVSPEQKVKKRKTSKCGKRVKVITNFSVSHSS